MKQILIPIDFSLNSFNCIEYALLFFRNEKVNFHLVHIAKMIYEEENFYNSSCSLERIKKEFEATLLKIKLFAPNELHSFNTYTVRASVVDWIRQFVTMMDVDMILLASKGDSKNAKKPVGWFTREIITKVKCTVLIIPENAQFYPPLNLGFLTDFNLNYKNQMLESLQLVLTVQGMDVKVIRVTNKNIKLNELQNINRAYFNDRLGTVQHSFHVLDNDKFEKNLQRIADTMELDFLGLMAKNLNFLKRLLFTEHDKVLRFSKELPCLILHE